MEGLTRSERFAPLLRLAVPIGFNAYRLGALVTWIQTSPCVRSAPHPARRECNIVRHHSEKLESVRWIEIDGDNSN